MDPLTTDWTQYCYFEIEFYNFFNLLISNANLNVFFLWPLEHTRLQMDLEKVEQVGSFLLIADTYLLLPFYHTLLSGWHTTLC